MSVILATWEAEIRRIVVQDQPSSQDPILKNTQHKKGLADWLKWQSTCLASVRPWVQTPELGVGEATGIVHLRLSQPEFWFPMQ
jgi:hypothetical protein